MLSTRLMAQERMGRPANTGGAKERLDPEEVVS
jgi:hypothetical protein